MTTAVPKMHNLLITLSVHCAKVQQDSAFVLLHIKWHFTMLDMTNYKMLLELGLNGKDGQITRKAVKIDCKIWNCNYYNYNL